MIATKVFSNKTFSLSLEGKNIPLTEAERASGKYDATDNYRREFSTTKKDLEQFPKFVQDAFSIHLNENLICKSRTSLLRYDYEIDHQMNDFIIDLGLKREDLIDIKYVITSDPEGGYHQSALLIYEDET